MPNDQAQNPNEKNVVAPMKSGDRSSPGFSKIPPLKIRGARGVMKIMEVTPCVPPYFKGGDLLEEGVLALKHSDFSRPCPDNVGMKSAICHLEFDIWVLTNGF